METINGYELIKPLASDNSGFSRWGFVQKNGIELFIKEFLSPVYPLNEALFSEEDLKNRKSYCENFVQRKRELYLELQNCHSGNIIITLDFFRNNTKYYIITEKVETATVSPEEIYEFGLLDKTTLARIICDSMIELHRHKIVHADLKPENILLEKTETGFYTAKIIDFDSSFLEHHPFSTEEIEGDPVYLAPETFLAMRGNNVELSSKVDVFSLGVLFYQYFIGRQPIFENSEMNYTFEAVLNGKEPSFPTGTDPHISKLLSAMLRKQPEKRPDLKKVASILKRVGKKAS